MNIDLVFFLLFTTDFPNIFPFDIENQGAYTFGYAHVYTNIAMAARAS
jgi:hypothetical protein